ncbi:Uncharacterised protein [Salmonella enterica subsp. enterica serovar Bovismorbificans]|uniref:Uncharacterized protein n=1 Tax=Salmonella enterica subsp. enterica serovar Bovismorbificans TaxID=58097 RepID=A0A655DP36_SALET|nr:Uncharacterised protein [Salmonella enterica subsp. enterica serovar Bovismorbificans]
MTITVNTAGKIKIATSAIRQSRLNIATSMAPINAALRNTVATTVTYRSRMTSVSLVTREINCPTGCVSKALSGWRKAASMTSVRKD